MALAATHIRFALEMREKLAVQDLEKYLSGTLYPDSRYFTRVPREVTHDEARLAGAVSLPDDFRKGWRMHLLCDKLQQRAMRELFSPELAQVSGTGEWALRTALKALQDIQDAKAYDARSFMEKLTWFETPSGEDREQLRTYYGFFAPWYAADTLSIEEEGNIWTKIGMPIAQVKQMIATARELSFDSSVMERVGQLYVKMLEYERENKMA